jgi:4-hydroxybenzoate polyprenyltransferase
MRLVVRRKLSFQDYVGGVLRLVRAPNLVIVVITQYLTRIFLIGPADDWRTIIKDPYFLCLSLSTVCIAAAGYVINDYFDVKIDLVNKPGRVVIGRYLKRRMAMGTHHVLNVIGVLLGLLVSWWIFLINVGSVTLLWFYSERYKRLPFIGNLIVSFLTALSFLLLTIPYPQNRHLVIIYAVFSFFISLVREVIKDMEDVRGDAAHGCRTLPIVWGLRKTKMLLYFVIVAFVLTLFLMAHSLENKVLAGIFVSLLLPLAGLVYKLVKADTRKDFAQLSSLCKIIMLLGLASMFWA